MTMRTGIGQYYPHPSFLHRLDPRVKAGCALAVMLVIFFIQTPLQLLYVYVLAGALIAASRIPAKKIAESIKPLVLILVFLGIFNLFFVRTGTPVFTLGPIEITSGRPLGRRALPPALHGRDPCRSASAHDDNTNGAYRCLRQRACASGPLWPSGA
ncbi:MAG: energy-coupling factor transporter transmembrane protein EcfT [Atopobiaceae bacterium]|nr:energy-coupling factor transporter transmembrane protein EcfT [Atopobiaceae bacterium]